MQAATAAAPMLQTVPIADLVESKTNPRHFFHPARLKELAHSVGQNGVLVPLVGRMLGKKIEVVDGARRFRAAKLAELASVPVMMHVFTDAQVIEIQNITNLQRDDLHPLEEAESFENLLKLEGYTVELIAEKISKDASYVYRRRQLGRLDFRIKKLFLDNAIGIKHATIIARQSAADQQLILKDGLYQYEGYQDPKTHKWENRKVVATPRTLEKWIDQHLLLVLAASPWDLDSPDLLPKAGSCTTCPKRSGQNQALFSDLVDKTERCLDVQCFNAKLNAHIARAISDAKAAGGRLAMIQNGWGVHGQKVPTGALNPNMWKKADKACLHQIAGIIVAGDNIGKIIDVCLTHTCKTHWDSGSGRSAKSPAEQWAEKKKQLEIKITSRVRHALLDQVLELVRKNKLNGARELELMGWHMIKRSTNDDKKELCRFLGVELAKGDGFNGGMDKKLIARVKYENEPQMRGLLLTIVLLPCLQGNDYYDKRSGGNLLDQVATKLGLDQKAIAAPIAKQIRDDFQRRKDAALKKKAKPAAAKKASKK